MTGRPEQEVTRIVVEPARACLYAEGWQSWSVTGQLPVTAAPYLVTSAHSIAIDCQYRAAAPAGLHQGSGLLAIDPGDTGPVRVFGTPDAAGPVPVIRARLRGSTVVVTSDGPVDQLADAGEAAGASATSRPTSCMQAPMKAAGTSRSPGSRLTARRCG